MNYIKTYEIVKSDFYPFRKKKVGDLVVCKVRYASKLLKEERRHSLELYGEIASIHPPIIKVICYKDMMDPNREIKDIENMDAQLHRLFFDKNLDITQLMTHLYPQKDSFYIDIKKSNDTVMYKSDLLYREALPEERKDIEVVLTAKKFDI